MWNEHELHESTKSAMTIFLRALKCFCFAQTLMLPESHIIQMSRYGRETADHAVSQGRDDLLQTLTIHHFSAYTKQH